MGLLQIIILVIVPPVGVFLKRGLGLDLLLSIVLTVLGYFPGLIHAIWVVTRDR